MPLNATARRALQTYLDEREETGTQDPVFLSDTGAALSVRSISCTCVAAHARPLRNRAIAYEAGKRDIRRYQAQALDES